MFMRPALVALTLAGVACASTQTTPPEPTPVATAPVAVEPPRTNPAQVRIGRCAGLGNLEETKAAGFDYVELPVQAIAKLSDEEFEAGAAKHAALGFPTPVANSFFPGDIKLVGPAVDDARIDAYVSRAFDRLARLGVKIVVLGSGKAREVPEGFSKDDAFRQLVVVARRIAAMAQQRGIVVAVEPLRKAESNIINTAAEGLGWVKAVGHPHFQLMVDFFHLSVEQESPAILVSARQHIKHFHMANPNGRVYPLDASEYDYRAFFDNLMRMGFSGGISVEAKVQDFATEGPKAVAFLRSQLQAASPVASASR